MTDSSIAEILLVEDDPIDVQIFSRAAQQADFELPIQVVGTGEEAFKRLRALRVQKGRNATLVVTDINMPGLTGHELMEDVRKDEQLRSTIFFVLSSSDQAKDMAQAYDNGAAGYIVKEQSQSATRGCVDLLKAYCATVRLP